MSRRTRLVGLAVLALASLLSPAPAQASLAGLQVQIHQAIGKENMDAAALDARVNSLLERSDVLHTMQDQIAQVTRSMSDYLANHAASPDAAQPSHEEVSRLQATLDSLRESQAKIEEQHKHESEADHASLLQLMDAQQRQQQLLEQELAHSRSLEQELLQLKQNIASGGGRYPSNRKARNAHDAPHAHSQNSHQPTPQHALESDLDDDLNGDGAIFLQLSQSPVPAAAVPDFEEGPNHREHDIDLSHTMDHSRESSLEAQERLWEEQQQLLESKSEESLGQLAAAQANQIDPSRFSSSSDYLAAMDSAEDAEDMSPQQLASLEARMGGHQVGMPQHPNAHSMSEIESLVAAGEAEVSTDGEFHFDSAKLRTPGLRNVLSDAGELPSEDSILSAMQATQAKIKAIAAELQKHQLANGIDHSAGIEIEVEDVGADELPNAQPLPARPAPAAGH